MSCAGTACQNFFWGVFKFQCMLLEKKSYLIDFSFKLQLCGGAQVVFSKFAGVCVANYCPVTPTEYRSSTRARQLDLLYL